MLLKINRKYFSSYKPTYIPICIIGGGSGSINLAAQLMQQKDIKGKDIRVFEPSINHFYGPSFTMIGGGLIDPVKNQSIIYRKTRQQFNRNIDIVNEYINEIKPEQNLLIDSKGNQYSYGQLVIASGMTTDYSFAKGLQQCLDDKDYPVSSIYDFDYAVKVQKQAKLFKGGNAIFTESVGPVKCGGAPQKIIFLLDDQWRKNGINYNITFLKQPNVLFGQADYSQILQEIHRSKSINVQLQQELIEVDKNNQTATFKGFDGSKQILKFDFLHVVPRFKPSKFINDSGLADVNGFLNLDVNTLQHKKYQNIWGMGDCAALPTSKTAAAIYDQSTVLKFNLLNQKRNSNLPKKIYDGYTACPIFVGQNKLLLAEFKYNGVKVETFAPFINQAKPNWFFFLFKRYLFPFVYWNFVNRGIWRGRKFIGIF